MIAFYQKNQNDMYLHTIFNYVKLLKQLYGY